MLSDMLSTHLEPGAMTPSNTNAQSLLKRYEFKLLRLRQAWLLLVACLTTGLALAQGAPEAKPAPAQQNTPQGQQARLIR
jgi:hypothetical protein